MLQIITASGRHHFKNDWLSTYHLFSFDDYYDPANVEFGCLRVFNDDTVSPSQGFPMHPHAGMEIVTVVLAGAISHEDSAGHKKIVKTGEVQRMFAGSGVQHSENNLDHSPLHLYQIWFHPRHAMGPVEYSQKSFPLSAYHNALRPLVSGYGEPGALDMHSDATLYRSHLEKGKTVAHTIQSGRGVFIYIGQGSLTLNGKKLALHEQARITDIGPLLIKAAEDTNFILIDVAMIRVE